MANAVVSGIGLETSLQFAAEGGLLLISDINDVALNKAVELISKKFPSAQPIGQRCDVSTEADVKALIDTAVTKWGRLDVLFNNAGIMHPAYVPLNVPSPG